MTKDINFQVRGICSNLKNNLKVKELVKFGKDFFKSKSKINISKKKYYELRIYL